MSDVSPPEAAALDAAGFADLTRATPVQMADLERFRAMLAETNAHTNMVGRSTLDAFWSRHAWDSAQLLPLAPSARVWADIGAGAGFPGLVLAIMLKGREGAHVHLVESMAKRCRFLGAVTAALDLPATVHNDRAENIDLKVDIVTARACAPFVRLLGYAYPMLKRGGEGLFLKGQEVEAELSEAAQAWRFQAELSPSLSDPRGRVVKVRGLSHVRRS